MASVSDFRRGMVIRFKDDLYTVVEFQHVKPGKGAAFIRSKLKSVTNEKVIDNTFRSSDNIEEVTLLRKELEFLYDTGDLYYFMHPETFEQIPVNSAVIGDAKNWMKENMKMTILEAEGKIIGIELPNFVEYKIEQTEPGIKGNTVSNTTKPAVLETGATINVPLFVNEGDVIRVDTRTQSYMERV